MNLKKFTVFLVLLLAVSLLVSPTALARSISNGNGNGDGTNDLDLSILEPGDIVLVRGGDGIIPITGDWDHAILYAGDGKVVESVADGGVRKIDASVIHGSEQAGAFRVDAPASIRQGAVDFAENQIGDDYSFRWLRWPGEAKEEADAWYCTELAWASYKNQGVNINANSGYHWRFWNNVSGTCIADSEKTEMIEYAD